MQNDKLLIISECNKVKDKSKLLLNSQYDFFENQLDLIYDWTNNINAGESVKININSLLRSINNMETEIISLTNDINRRVKLEIENDRRMENAE